LGVMTARSPGEQLNPLLERARSTFGFGYAHLARLLLVNEATLYRWRNGLSGQSPRAQDRLVVLEQFLEAVSVDAAAADDPAAWLDEPVPGLGGETPRALLLAGRLDLLTGYLVGRAVGGAA
jgi:hypothetical protein